MARNMKVTAAALLAAALVTGGLTAAPASAAARPQTAVASFDGPSAGALRASGVRVLARHRHVGAVTVSGTPRQLAALSRQPNVRGVAPDAPLRPTSHTNGGNTGSVFAWEKLGSGAGERGSGAGVRVAVVDTGISDTPALSRASGRLVDAVDTSGSGTGTDGYGHGTFMAGIVAGGPVEGTGSKGLGVAPGATVLNVKVADATGTTSLAKVVAGLDWVAAHASSVDVASFSFSRTRPGTGYGPDPLTDAVEHVRDAGVTVVVSAGNVAGEVGDPGFAPKAFTVGAADSRKGDVEVAEFSGSAVVAGVRKPDLVASGVGVLSVLPPSSVIATDNPQSRHSPVLWRGSGTSQATAQAAGAVALFLQDFPGATPSQVKASLRSAARNLNDSRAGAGLLRVARSSRDGSDGPGAGDSGGDGEGGFDANSWSANSWSANSWSANSWSANSWSANSWSANSWSANSWSFGSKSANSWSRGGDH